MQKMIISQRRTNWPKTANLLQVPPRNFKSNKILPPSELHRSAKKFSIRKQFITSAAANESISEQEISLLLHHESRLSLAYGALEEIPCLILKYMADKIKILDLSHNRFRNLSFLQSFSNLQTLILDKNSYLDCQSLPSMKSLEILWLNNCNLINVSDWLTTLQVQCPALKQLSMMCNPVGWTVLNGVSEHDEREYLTQILKILPNLEYFDGIRINDEHRQLAIGRKKLSFALLEEIFHKKLMVFINFSTKLHKNYMSMDKLNAHFVKNKSLIDKKQKF
ncbi:leucine-rich melanocyte differentiation-associated protein-like [Episyrphus balteatus]|uniref:leucine-rich melanocyte differentiation-associated protein-like n=1 Tax=Episyrphus balteatus TaxID=286459 RepID=UPI0024851049|nr:leucine-rich melanocyte differentiation-associated protein-like [Episyrphus balteatus]